MQVSSRRPRDSRLACQPLQGRGDQAGQDVHNEQLDEDCREPQHQHPAIVQAELPGEVVERRPDKQLPSLAEALVECGQSDDIIAPVVAVLVDRARVSSWPETISQGGQPGVDRAHMAQFDNVIVAACSGRSVGRREDHSVLIQEVAKAAFADATAAQIGRKAIQGDVCGNHANRAVAHHNRSGHGKTDEAEGPEHFGVSDRHGAGGNCLAIPRPRARIVAALRRHLAKPVLPGVEEDVAIEHGRTSRRLHEPIGELGARGRQRVMDRHVLIVNAARLTKRPVLEPDVDIEDGCTVLKDAKEVGECAIVLEEPRVLAAELGSRADQRL